MKEIQIPEGYVFDSVSNGTIYLKEIALDTWERCFHELNVSDYSLQYVDADSEIKYVPITKDVDYTYWNSVPAEYSDALLALTQLLVCYKAWTKDWKPDWLSMDAKYCIGVTANKVQRSVHTGEQYLLAFPTLDMRDKFFETFKSLIEQAKPLL
jgi:hypothetical protein